MQNRVSWKFSHDHYDDHLDADDDDDDDGDNDEGDDDDHDSVSSSSPPDVRSWQLAFTLGAILPFCSLALVVMKMMLSDTKGMIMMQRQWLSGSGSALCEHKSISAGFAEIIIFWKFSNLNTTRPVRSRISSWIKIRFDAEVDFQMKSILG